ncbi:MAG: hypothetical protein ACYCQJ_08935 [Nitrososphaerales archaeon]
MAESVGIYAQWAILLAIALVSIIFTYVLVRKLPSSVEARSTDNR